MSLGKAGAEPHVPAAMQSSGIASLAADAEEICNARQGVSFAP